MGAPVRELRTRPRTTDGGDGRTTIAESKGRATRPVPRRTRPKARARVVRESWSVTLWARSLTTEDSKLKSIPVEL